MTDERPKIFDQCTPQPAPAALRSPTLAADERELARRRTPRWERGFELAVAASLVLGIGLNTWLWRHGGALQMGISERAPSVAARIQHQPLRAGSEKRGKDVVGNDRYQRLLHELSQGRIPESL